MLPHVGASVASDVTRKAARKEQPAALLSRAQPPIPQPHTSVGRELRVRHIVRPDVDLGSNSVLSPPPPPRDLNHLSLSFCFLRKGNTWA